MKKILILSVMLAFIGCEKDDAGAEVLLKQDGVVEQVVEAIQPTDIVIKVIDGKVLISWSASPELYHFVYISTSKDFNTENYIAFDAAERVLVGKGLSSYTFEPDNLEYPHYVRITSTLDLKEESSSSPAYEVVE